MLRVVITVGLATLFAAAIVSAGLSGSRTISGSTTISRSGNVVTIRGGPGASDIVYGAGAYSNGFVDNAGSLRAGAGCESSAPNRLSCGPANWTKIVATLGGGADHAGGLIFIPKLIADGGRGNDEISGNAQNDRLSGGPGNDALYGSSGSDTLTGGPGVDLVKGGPGVDTCYVGRGDIVRGCEIIRRS